MGKKLPKTSKYVLKIIQKAIDEKATFIDLGNCGLQAVPKELAHLPDTITHINLGNDEITIDVKVSPHQKGINNFKKHTDSFKILELLKNLRKLELSYCQINNKGVIHISDIVQLIELDISHNSISNQGAISISKLNKLSKLNIEGNRISNKGIIAITNIEGLKELNANWNHIRTKGIIAISKLEQLTKLHLSSNYINNKGFNAITRLINLTELDISDTLKKNKDFTALSILKKLEKLEKLEKLNISFNEIGTIKTDSLSKLSNLIRLDISNCGITNQNINFINNLSNLKYLDIEENEIGDEGVLAIAKLTLLEELNISGNNINDKSLINFSNLTQLIQLDISYNNISAEGISIISKLTQLQELYISNNNIGNKGTKNISKLTQLKDLNISNNNIDNQGTKNISKLTQLKELDISNNNISNQGTENIAKLIQLEHLNISNNSIGNQGTENITNLIHLEHLNINNNNIDNQGTENIAKLIQLEYLNISNNNIGNQGTENIAKLLQLEHLNISNNNIGNQGTENITKLIQLEHLNISNNNIGNEGIIKIFKISNLNNLLIDNNKITNEGIAVFLKLNKLNHLNIDENKIKNKGIKEILNHPNLNFLSIENNLITKILPSIKLNNNGIQHLYLNLLNNPIKDAPQSIIQEYNCINSLRIWKKQVKNKKKTKKNTLIKLQVLGNGNAGKSSLIEALAHKKCDHDFTSTHGVVIKPLHYNTKKKKTNFQVWDFGGQEIYHGTHKLFLRSQAIHVLVGDQESELLAKEKKRVPDRDREEELVLHQPLQHYINLSKQQSPDSTRIAVENKIDLKEKKDDLLENIAVKNDITMYPSAATKGTGIKTLRKVLQKKQKNILQYGMIMPKSWINVRQYFLDNLNEELSFKRQLINRKQFNDICKRYKVMKEAIPDLLDFLHHTGIIYKNDDLIKDTIIIDQQWALDAIYKPLDRTSEFYKQLRNDFIGRVQVKYLFNAFGPEYREEHKWLFLNFMESCYLCFPLHKKQEYEENKTLEDYYIFPEFLPEEETPAVTNLWKTKGDIKTYTHAPDYLDYYRIQKFIVALGQKTKIEHIWKSGILVTTKKGMFHVSTDTQSTKLIIQIESTAIDDYLWSIIDTFKKYQYAQESLKWLQDDGSELNIQTLKKPQNTLERKLHSQENTHHEIEKDRKQINLKELLPDQEQIPPKTLVISFASENIKDVKAVELSLKNYKANGRLQVLYDKKIMTGTRYWNPAIQEMFQKADGYLMLVSMEYQDFEERTYIWEHEIPIIEKRLEEEGVFAYCMSVEPVAYNDRLDKFQAFKGGGTNCLPEKGHKRKRFLVEFAKEVIENQFLKEDEK